jgi:hypothetical protein
MLYSAVAPLMLMLRGIFVTERAETPSRKCSQNAQARTAFRNFFSWHRYNTSPTEFSVTKRSGTYFL